MTFVVTDGNSVAVCERDGIVSLPHTTTPPRDSFTLPNLCACRPEQTSVGGSRMINLRGEARSLLSEDEYSLAIKGAELLTWDSEVRFCSQCGAPLKREGICKRCGNCGREHFPSPAPAVLVLVTKGEEALLVHARNFRHPFFGLVAGFIETGESAEQCVAREVREETSLTVTDIRYFGSQPWPFPFNLMIGYTARYVSGEIAFADRELSRGGFFSRDNLPPLAPPGSLARDMIDAWIEYKL